MCVGRYAVPDGAECDSVGPREHPSAPSLRLNDEHEGIVTVCNTICEIITFMKSSYGACAPMPAAQWSVEGLFMATRRGFRRSGLHRIPLTTGPAPGLLRHYAPSKAASMSRHLRELGARSEEHTSELQSLMRISYAVFC